MRGRRLTVWVLVAGISLWGTSVTPQPRPRLSFPQVEAALRLGKNLGHQDLSGLDLTGLNFRGADLRAVNLTDADLEGVALDGADLRGAILVRANLRRAQLTGADLGAADLTDAYLDGVTARRPGTGPD